MELFATYCSAEKDGAEGELPAIERYTSERIQGVAAAAKGAQAKFGIMSGQSGLITGEHPLPYYDHLLQPEEVSTRAEGAVETLRAWGITRIRWFSVAFEMDPNVGRYRDVMTQAATACGIEIELELWEPTGTLGLV